MFDWIKKHKILIVIASIFIIAGVPLLIHVLFKINTANSFWVAEWEAGDVLGYYGSILSFIGTVVLGILALYQNHIIKMEADKRTKLLEEKEYESNMPKFVANPNGSNSNTSNLNFTIRNISENLASEVIVYDVKVIKPNNEIFWNTDATYKHSAISSNSEYRIGLKNPPIQEDGYTFSMEMQCADKYNNIHKYIIKGTCEKAGSFPQFKITEITQ